MPEQRDVVLVGNAVAVLAAAHDLTERGRKVTVLNSTPNWGGHFAGMRLHGQDFDLGMVFPEFWAFNVEEAPDPLTYDRHLQNDCGRFSALCGRWLNRFVEMHEIAPPEVMFRGRTYPDIILTNQLDILKALSPEESSRARAELQSSLSRPDDPRHARQKIRSPRWETLSYSQAAAYNHGPTLDGLFFSPVLWKVFHASGDTILARYHRIAWLPMYYPETLLEVLEGGPQTLHDTPLYYPTTGSLGRLFAKAGGSLKTLPNAEVLPAAITALSGGPGQWRVTLTEGQTLTARSFAWALDQGSLLEALGEDSPRAVLEKTSITLAFLSVPKEQVPHASPTVFFPEDDTPFYRVTNLDACVNTPESRHRLIVEANPAHAGWEGLEEAAIKAQIHRGLCAHGLVEGQIPEAFTIKTLKNALALPTAQNRQVHNAQLERIQAMAPGMGLMASSGVWFTASLNDQIVQGLQFSRQQEGDGR